MTSRWSDDRSEDVHELYVVFGAGREEPGVGLCLWREYDEAGGPDPFAEEPMIAFEDREPEGEIARVELTRSRVRIVLGSGDEVIADFDLQEGEFRHIRDALRAMFADRNMYSEDLAGPDSV